MPVLTQMATSTNPVRQVVNAPDGIDPTSDPVLMQFVRMPASGPPPNPSEDGWITAYWTVTPGPVYWATLLVGPANGGVELAAGSYAIAVRVVDNPAVPELWGWTLIIT